jgi:hypothetical protein
MWQKLLVTALLVAAASQAVAGAQPPASSHPVDVTHAELLSLSKSGALTRDQLYRITDFRTSHVIPNTADRNTAPTEVLLVRAASATQIRSQAFSESYPEDIIYYELTDSTTQGGDRGRIIKRVDPLKQISSFEDWRNVKFRRWNTQADGRGRYTAFTDNGNPWADYHPICNATRPDDMCFNIELGRPASDATNNLTNVVIGKGARDIVTGPYVVNTNIGAGSNEIYLKGTLTDFNIGDNCHQIEVGLCADYSSIGDWASSITIGSSSGHAEIASGAYNIHIGDYSPSMADNGFKIGNGVTAPTNVTIGPNLKGTGNPVIAESNVMLVPQTLYVGNGAADAAPANGELRSTGASGRDAAGGALRISAGAGTGSAGGGKITFATAPAGSPGATANPQVAWLALDSRGHLSTAAAGEEPALSNCGTSASIAPGSTDMAGTFSIGLNGTGCTVTFKRPFGSVPACLVTAELPSNLARYGKNATGFTVTGRPGTYNYVCYGLNEK